MKSSAIAFRTLLTSLAGAILLFATLFADLEPVWACTVFTDRFDDQPVDSRFIRCFDVTASAGPNGVIAPDSFRFVPQGDVLSFLVSPEPGYQIDQVSGCDGNIEAMTSYVTGPIIKDCHVAATFTNLGECSLWEQNCPSPQGCYVVSPDGTTTCASSGGKVIGESCDFINECAPGLICAGAPGGTSCRQLCNTNGSVSCDTGDCVGIGISNIGACY